MEEENLTYGKCCTTPVHTGSAMVSGVLRGVGVVSPLPPRDVLTRSVSPLPSNVYILISLQTELEH